ncbi:hypothetical protein E3N88_44916 [Mikania micrantha]|uniref:Uncharacterized protein n=1 Tax=Mikania micrantha TaxID=192012 RepID=A0A5N6LD14_9ASTR|nr:hypothetical protein E3N88_44916 [Mikania micrantha]
MKTLNEYLNYVSSVGYGHAGGRDEAFLRSETTIWGKFAVKIRDPNKKGARSKEILNVPLEIGVPMLELPTVKISRRKRALRESAFTIGKTT